MSNYRHYKSTLQRVPLAAGTKKKRDVPMVAPVVDDRFREALEVALTYATRSAGAGNDPLEIEGFEGGWTVLTSSGGPGEALGQLGLARAHCRAQLASVHHSLWWEAAEVVEIVTMYEMATLWRGWDLVAWDADETIRHELYDRYGITVPAVNPADIPPMTTRSRKPIGQVAAPTPLKPTRLPLL